MPDLDPAVQWNRRHERVAESEGIMKYSNSHRRTGTGTGRTSRSALNPYCIEDVAMTPQELERVRSTADVWIMVRG